MWTFEGKGILPATHKDYYTFTYPHLIKGNVYEARNMHISLLHAFAIVFVLACTSHNRLGKMLNAESVESVNVKEKFMHGCGPSEINCSSFNVIAFEGRLLS